MNKQQITLSRIQFIADIAQVAQCDTSELLLAMSLISELASQALLKNITENNNSTYYSIDESSSFESLSL